MEGTSTYGRKIEPMKRKILLIGGGGHAESIIDSVNTLGYYRIEGIIDQKEKLNQFVLGVKIIGEDKDLAYFYKQGIKNAVLSFGGIKYSKLRRNIYETCKNIGYQFPNVIDKSAIISKYVILGEGNFIGKGVVINANVKIGNVCIINSRSVVEHDCCINDFVHLAPGSVLCGNVWVKKNSHIGAQSVILQNITIGEDTLVGAGSLVLNNIESCKIAYGSPAREVKDNETC
jgi:sugar O-acyltransferase (sialic acid O-acetyltransferase NeuD family)